MKQEHAVKLAQMNTKAVTAKLTEYENRIAKQEQRIAELEAKMTQLQQQLIQLQMVAAQVGSFGNGPTVRS